MMEKKLRLALIGYGKMGKEIEKIAIERGHTIIQKLDITNNTDINKLSNKDVDVALEFTTPASAYQNIMHCFELNIPVVSGTTGWYTKLDEVKEQCLKQNQSFFFGSNFSIGVNMLFAINKQLAKYMNEWDNYEVDITEIHHTQKLDSPSGTAIILANDIIENLKRKKSWNLAPVSGDELKIKAVRENEVPGTHIISYQSDFDSLELIHISKNRKGFATGAVKAAEYLHGKKGVFTMEHLMNL